MTAVPLLQVRHLRTHFRTSSPGKMFGSHAIKAVDDVSFDVNEGEVLSLVGESGCGKTTVGRTITKLEKATSGEVLFDGRNILLSLIHI